MPPYANPNATAAPIPLRPGDVRGLADASCRACHGEGACVVVEPPEALAARQQDADRAADASEPRRVLEPVRAHLACLCVRRALRLRDDVGTTATGAYLWLPGFATAPGATSGGAA